MKVRLPLSLFFACATSSVVAVVAGAATPTTGIPVLPSAVFSDPLLGKQWQWNTNSNGINIAPVWKQGILGTGVVIGIIDDWVEPNHEDLNVSPYNPGTNLDDGLSKDFVGSEELKPGGQNYTGESHGTFVAGMAAATGGNGTGLVGAAPGATIAGLHVDLSLGQVTDAAWWASGVTQAGSTLTYSGEAAIQVKNCSFGSTYGQAGNKPFADAIKATSKNNVIYVFAAGNSRGNDGHNLVGSTGWDSQGNNSSIINVGATNSKGTYADFSSFGSNIFITAPGADVISTDRTGELGYNAGNALSSPDDGSDSGSNTITNPNYASSSGTSFSSPLVAGVVALGKEICPVMDVRWAKHALAWSSGHNNAPNIDAVYDPDKKTWVQKSGYSKSETDEDGEQTTERIIPTGDWVKNAGGYWFNNNYGFGLVDPEGFIKQVRDIAYTTIESAHAVDSSKITKTVSTETTGDVRSAEYSVDISKTGTSGTASGLNQSVETVSVSVTFSEDAVKNVNFNVNSFKLILTDSKGIESVLVQQSNGDPNVSLGGEDPFSYTFLSNAFWGSSYSAGDWKVRIEYTGITADGAAVDMTDWVTIGGLDFTMGGMVNEGDLSFVNRTENAHALVLDSKSFTVGSGGKFFVEDAFYVNAGEFHVRAGGQIGAYEGAELKKGAIFVQTGGNASIYGQAVFERGLHLYGGNFTLGSTITSGGDGTIIYGGTFTVAANEDNIAISAGEVVLNGGQLILSENADFGSSVAVNGGQFTAGSNSTGTGLTIAGGLGVLGNKTKFNSISVGLAATDSEEAKGGGLIFTGATTVTGGVQLNGFAVAEIQKNAVLSNTSAVSVAGSAYLSLIENTQIKGALAVTGGTAAWTGKTKIGQVSVSGGVFAAYGTTTLETTQGVSILNGGSFKVGKTTVNGNVTVEAGGSMIFASRSRSDYDFLTVKSGDNIRFVAPAAGQTTTLKYDFGDTIPYEATLIKLSDKDATFSEDTMDALDFATITPGEGTPQILDDSKRPGVFVPKDMDFGVKEVSGSLILSLGQDFDNLHLYYSSQSSLYSAVQTTLLRNEAFAEEFLNEFNKLEHVSELFSTAEKLAVPANVVAIDELHDKQANAVVGAISRRSRELRSGFIHSDTWSNPLFGSSGFSFSARPNLVAAKGFVPYAMLEEDFPLMVWINGGYSFSAVDDGAMSVSSTKSNMLNLAMGADYAISENLAIGVFAGYTSGRTKFDDGGRTEIQSRNVGLYLTGSKSSSIGSLYYTAGAAYGYEEYDFSRKMTVGDINSKASASPDGWQGVAFLEGGYEWKLKKFSMGPSLSLRYVLNNIDGYTESSTHDWSRQEVDDVSYDSLQSSVGWRVAYRADFETVSLLPELRISWNHEFIGVDEDFDARLAMPDSSTYTNTINSTGDDYATFGAGVTVMLGEVSTLSLDYDMQFMRKDADPVHSINAIFRTRF